MWRAIFWFEVRYQCKQPVLYLVTFLLSVLLFLDGTDRGASGRLLLNAPPVILEHMLTWVYLALFLVTAFAVSAAVRDFERGSAELFFSKPISRFAYVTARYVATIVVCLIPYVAGTIALAVGPHLPGADPSRVAPFSIGPYAFGLAALILPTVAAFGAAIFALALVTRSTISTYVGGVAFFAVSASAALATSRLESQWAAQLMDPLGVIALSSALKYWTVAELNATTPALTGMLLVNRVLWLGLGAAAFVVAMLRFDPERSRTTRWSRVRALVQPSVADREATSVRSAPRPAPVWVTPAFTRRTMLEQFVHQVRRETTRVLMSMPLAAMFALGLIVLLQAASSAGAIFGMPVYPSTSLMVDALQGKYSVIVLLVVVLYSGELIWKERSLGLAEVTDSMPTPVGVYLLSKIVTLLLVVGALLLAGAAALIAFQLAGGYTEINVSLYASGLMMAALYPALMAVLACFCHVLARSKLMGYGAVLLFIVSWDLLEEFGFEHHLYRYASLPPALYSDFSKFGPFLEPFRWFSLYWGLIALTLVGLSVLFWRRGTDVDLRPRWHEARRRFSGAVSAVLILGGAGSIAAGSWIFYNTNVLNAYVPNRVLGEQRATYEQRYAQYQSVMLPRITAVESQVDIYPEDQRVQLRGSYQLRNQSDSAQRDIHVSVPERVRVNRFTLPAHDVVLSDEAYGYYVFRLHEPLAPQAIMAFGFDVALATQGFVNNGALTSVVENGTHFTKRELFPVIGYDAHRQLEDPDERRRLGLAPAPRMAAISDTAAYGRTPRAVDADRVAFESTISTSVDQIAVTSGELQREWVANGRRHFHFRAEVPITHHFAFASARYAVARSAWEGVNIEVYHHPDHDQNVRRMLDAARQSLAYNTAYFGPYQHRTLRIVEFPRYQRDATSFPGMITISESMGFNARLDGKEAVDYPFYVTAHEVAHQWWGQQLVGANVQGVGMLHETLAQYSALMVMEREFTRRNMPRVLEYEHEWYLRGRGGERDVELPVALAERQDYVYYHKGALAMYALRDAVGELTLNGALQRFLTRFAVGRAPYGTTGALLEEFRQSLPIASHELIAQLFQTITTFNIGVGDATYQALSDGTFQVRVEVTAKKRRTDTLGVERELAIDDVVDVAVYADANGASDGASALLLQPTRIRASRSTIEFVVARKPSRIVLDPYFKLVDRERGDNRRELVPGHDSKVAGTLTSTHVPTRWQYHRPLITLQRVSSDRTDRETRRHHTLLP